jgi:hypothetical protein
MENNEITMLLEEVKALREKVSLLESEVMTIKERADFDRKNMIKFSLDRVRELDPYIFPTFYKVFPNFAKDDEQIDAIIKWRPTGHSHGQTKDGKEII